LAGSIARYQQEKDALETVEEALSAHSLPIDCGKVNLERLILG